MSVQPFGYLRSFKTDFGAVEKCWSTQYILRQATLFSQLSVCTTFSVCSPSGHLRLDFQIKVAVKAEIVMETEQSKNSLNERKFLCERGEQFHELSKFGTKRQFLLVYFKNDNAIFREQVVFLGERCQQDQTTVYWASRL